MINRSSILKHLEAMLKLTLLLSAVLCSTTASSSIALTYSCPQYLIQPTQVTVNSYASLSCALGSGVSSIFINSSFAFPAPLTIQQSNVQLYGLGTQITLSSNSNSGLFNITTSSAVTMQDLILTGAGTATAAGPQRGGLLSISHSKLILNHTVLTNGYATCGSAIYASHQAELYLWNTNVTENDVWASSLCSAAVYLSQSSLNATHCHFRNNVAYSAGAIYAVTSTVALYDVTLAGNQAIADSAGALAVDTSALHMQSCTVQNNIAEKHAGALSIVNSRNVILSNVKFTGNVATQGFGGSVYVRNSTVDFWQSQVYSSHALSGGGVYIANGILRSHDIQYMYNFALYGGAMYCSDDAHVQVNRSTVSHNVVRAIGAGISAATNCSLHIVSSTFTNNAIKVTDTPLSLGGGISCQQAVVHIASSNVSQCSANEGGALFAYECELTVTDMHMSNIQSAVAGIYASASQVSVTRFTAWNNVGNDGTGVFFCGDQSNCNIQSSNFYNNSALELGAIQILDSYAIIEDSTFKYNVAKGLAGAVYLMYAHNTVVRNCLFQGNVAINYGGAIVIEIQSKVNITASTFIQNKAVSGGALYVFAESQLDIAQSSFDRNTAADSGGSLYVGDGCTVSGQQLNITHSISPYGGGIYCSFNSTLKLHSLNAQYNRAGYAGGVVALFDQAYLQISNSNFSNNEAALGGVVSGQYYTFASFSHCTFNENLGESYGGIAYILVSSSLTLSSCIATENRAQFGGGGIFAETSLLMLQSSTFTGHHAEAGATLQLINSVAEAWNCRYIGNGVDSMATASELMTYQGGVMFLSSSSSLQSHYCNYEDNAALLGGSLAIEDSKVVLEADSFTGCEGKSGACIYAIVNSSLSMQYTLFAQNLMTFSASVGLVSMNSGHLQVAHSTFRDNTLGVFNLASVNTKIFNSSFSHNTITTDGGAMYVACTSPCVASPVNTNISTCRFEGNAAYKGFGGAIFINSFPGNVSVANNVFDSNLALNGGAIASQQSDVYIEDNFFSNNTAVEGGGAVFWKYNALKQTRTSNNKLSNNTASYGPYHATEFIALNASFPTSSLQVSGSSLSIPVYVSLIDFYSQVVTKSSIYDDASTTIYCSVNQNTGIIKGQSIVPSIHGVATFSELVITGFPGNLTQLRFTAPVSSIEDDLQDILFRDCIAGEITNNIGKGLAGCELCPAGLYSLQPSDTECSVCPNNVYCLGGDNLWLEKNFWRIDSTSDTILECPVLGVCLGGNDTSTQCATGQSGPYCSVCESGYTKGSDGVCYSCHSDSDVGSQVASTVVFIVLVFLVLVLYKFRKHILRYYMQKMKVIVKNRKFSSLRVKAKIVVAFIQIVGQFGPAFNIVYPVNFSNFLNFFSFFQVNILYFPNINCMLQANYYDGLLFTTISPFVIFLVGSAVVELLVIHAKRLNHRNPWYTASRAKEDRITILFLLSYFVLITVSTNIFQVYACETFDNNESYLVADYSINCNDSFRYLYLAYGTAMIFVYPIGIPFAYAVMLFRNRKFINPDWRKVIDASEKVFVSNKVIQTEKIKIRNTYEEIENIKNLYDSYTPKRWYFELFDCARRLALGALPVLIARGTSLQIIVVLMVSLASVGAFMYLNPYIHAHDNDLAILAQWSITMVIISTLVIKVEALSGGRESTAGLGGVLIFLNVAIVVFSIATALVNSKETSDDDPKGIFGEDLELDEDEDGKDGDGDGDGDKDDVEAGTKTDKQQPKTSRGSVVDSDVGSDGEDASSITSDDAVDDHKKKNGSSSSEDVPAAPADESPSNSKMKGIFRVMRKQSVLMHGGHKHHSAGPMEVEMRSHPSSVHAEVMNPVLNNVIKPQQPVSRFLATRDQPDSDDEVEE